MNRPEGGRPGLRLARLLDTVTVILALAAAVVAARHFMPERPARPVAAPDPSEVERSLVGRGVDTLWLMGPGTAGPQPLAFTASAPQLVLVYRSNCPACRRTEPVWVGLASAVDSEVLIHAITSEPAGTGLGMFGKSRVRVWRASPETLDRAFPSPFVPLTLVVAPEGVVRYARVGALTAGAVDTLQQVLSAYGRRASVR